MNLLKIVFCIFILIVSPEYVSAKCIVYLNNDRTLEADSCRKEGDKVKLYKKGLTFAVESDFVRKIIVDENKDHISSGTSDKINSKNETSTKSDTKKADLSKKRKSIIEGVDNKKVGEIMKQVDKLKEAYKILDKKPEEF